MLARPGRQALAGPMARPSLGVVALPGHPHSDRGAAMRRALAARANKEDKSWGDIAAEAANVAK